MENRQWPNSMSKKYDENEAMEEWIASYKKDRTRALSHLRTLAKFYEHSNEIEKKKRVEKIMRNLRRMEKNGAV